ncbi:hypothetical protein ACFX2I_029816 [Malus domestica]
MIACSKIEEAPPSESREPDSQHDYFLKNRRDTALRISRARPQHDCFLKNRRGIVLRISRARYHRPLFQSALTELKHVKLAAPTTVL